MSDQRFIDRIDRYRLVLFLLGVVPLIGFVTMDGANFWPSDIPVWVESIASEYINAFVPWFFLLALMAYGRRFLNFSNRFLKYFAEGAYPIYILHNTVIIIIAFFVVECRLSMGAKYAIIIASSFVVTVLIYDILVKRTNITRFLFGMKPQSKK